MNSLCAVCIVLLVRDRDLADSSARVLQSSSRLVVCGLVESICYSPVRCRRRELLKHRLVLSPILLGHEVWRSHPVEYLVLSGLHKHRLRYSEVFLVVVFGRLFLAIEVSRPNMDGWMNPALR